MKIQRLDLIAFGPFTNVALPLEAGQHGLHIIYGPNEAGKSSALRALTCLLYGFAHRSDDDFIHPKSNLRVGASIQRPDGSLLECIRRKATKTSLRASDDKTVLEESELKSLLESVSKEDFQQRFGIDHQTLTEGGKGVAAGGGDLGKMLFSAAAGTADLGSAQRELADQAAKLFKPNARAGSGSPAINRNLKERQEKKEQIKKLLLPTATWQKHHAACQAAQEQTRKLDEQLLELQSERERLDRFRQALPDISQRAKAATELKALADTPPLPDNFAATRTKAEQQLSTATAAKREAAKNLQRIDKAIADLNVPSELLDRAANVREVYQDLGAHNVAQKDRVKLVTERQEHEREATEQLADLGKQGTTLDDVAKFRIDAPTKALLRKLASEEQVLFQSLESTRESATEQQQQLETTSQQLRQMPPAQDLSELRSALAAARRHGDLEAKRRSLQQSLDSFATETDLQLQQLPQFNGMLAELERLAVPGVETIERFEAQLETIDLALGRHETTLADIENELADMDRQVKQLQLDQDVPTEDDLSTARQQRDELWQRLRDQLAGNAVVEADLPQAYQQSVEQADQVVDRLRREADRVAKKAALVSRREQLAGRLTEEQSRQAQTQAEQAQQLASWRQQWQPVGIEPRTPREMQAWATRQRRLVEAAGELRQQEEEVEQVSKQIDRICDEIDRALARITQSPDAPPATLSDLLEHAEAVLQQADDSRHRRESLERKLAELEGDLPTATRAADKAAEKLAAWRDAWAAAIQHPGMPENATPVEATSVMDTIDRLLTTLKAADALRERIEGIDADATKFRSTVQTLLATVAADLVDVPVEQAAARLHDRLNEAEQARAKLDGHQQQREVEQRRLDRAQGEIQSAEEKLDELCALAKCDEVERLPEIERQSHLRSQLEQRLVETEERLVRLSAGLPLDEFVIQSNLVDADELAPRLERLDEQITELTNELRSQERKFVEEETLLKGMDGADDAAFAREQEEELLSQIRDDAAQYIRLRTAAAVLSRAVERYREKNQGPVLRRASELFAELTLGSFSGLQPDFDSRGEPVLLGVCGEDGKAIATAGMSDGTCDQLYLALRLASLQTWLTERSAIPLVLDDILVNFDDDRSAAALKSLARLSEQTQVIFFTHHQHLVDLARGCLDDDVLFTHELPNVRGSAPAERMAGA